MKKAVVLNSIVLLLVFNVGWGQKSKPSWNEDTGIISYKGKEYAKMEKKPSSFITGSNYWIRNNENEVIIQFIYETYDCSTYKEPDRTCFREQVLFPQSNSRVFLSATAFGFGKKAVMKKLVSQELINDDGDLNWNRAKDFILSKNGRVIEEKVNGPSASNVVLKGNEIYQDDVVVGKYRRKESDIYYVYSIYNNDGSKIMTAQIEMNDPFEWVLTDSDGKTKEVLYEDDEDGIKILSYLARNGYLTK